MRVRFFTILLVLSVCGCVTVQDYHFCYVQKHRASTAWAQTHGRIASGSSRDYREGWKRGYYDLSTGQCNQPPPVPPHKYWHASYQSLEGRAAIDDWYSGWQDGASASEQDGRPFFNPVVTAPNAPAIGGDDACFYNGGPHGGNDVGPTGKGLETMPPVMPQQPQPRPEQDAQPRVHIGPVPPAFQNRISDDEELLDETSVPTGSRSGSANLGSDDDGMLGDSAGTDGYYSSPVGTDGAKGPQRDVGDDDAGAYE